MEDMYLLFILFTPVIMIGLGASLYNYPPKDIEDYYGYRTKRAMKSKETWKFAQKYAGKIWVITGVPTLAVSLFVFLYCNAKFAANMNNIFLLLLGIQLIIVMLPIPLVEHALKKIFDEHGKYL
ncbi:MAG: hypothetical protein K0S01_615 [Herbinix sp.]|jgi:uncharacterized membrane protein|nr:hypothetical protein [Herbinix sp.]